jgi:hypothetical protein
MTPNATLWDFLGVEPLSNEKAAVLEAGECLTRVAHELEGKVPGMFWSSTRREIDNALHSALSVPISDILAGGWNQYRALAQYRDRSKHPPNEVALVPLKEHTITSSHKPQIEIFLNDRRVGAIEFEVRLALKIEAAILKIQNAKIREIEAGSCMGSGTLLLGSAILFHQPTRKIQLPKVISFGEGLAI